MNENDRYESLKANIDRYNKLIDRLESVDTTYHERMEIREELNKIDDFIYNELGYI